MKMISFDVTFKISISVKLGLHKEIHWRSWLKKPFSITFSTLSRLLKALNIPASIEMSGVGKVALW